MAHPGPAHNLRVGPILRLLSIEARVRTNLDRLCRVQAKTSPRKANRINEHFAYVIDYKQLKIPRLFSDFYAKTGRFS